MNYRIAKMSLSLKILTAIILAMVAGLLIAGFHNKDMMAGGVVMGIITLVRSRSE